MAIPFNLPTDEETEENYRRLDQLLLDLYEVLRQILLRRRVQRVPTAPRPAEGVPQAQEPRQEQQAAGLPDLVPTGPLVRKPPVPPPRRRRRRSSEAKLHQGGLHQHRGSTALQQQQAEQGQQGPSWVNVGIELRQIAEEFRSTQFSGGEEKSRKEIKASSLFSLLVPAPLTGSIWTTVIILVGWRILARHR